MNDNTIKRAVAVLVAVIPLVAIAQTPEPTAEIVASVEGKVFRLTDPVGCVVWSEITLQNGMKFKAFKNQCTFRVEVSACGVGADRVDCGSPLGQIKYKSTTLDPDPPRPGFYQSTHQVQGMAPYPKVTSVVACPVEKFPDAGLPKRIWQLEKSGGLLTGKCLTPFDGPSTKVKAIGWPFYDGKISVKIVQD